jgi:hypothetical protein
MESYLQSERDGARFSLQDIMRDKLKIGMQGKEGGSEGESDGAAADVEASKS